MPTYIYKFIDTGETIEVQQAFTDASLTEAVHPTSGATMAVKKVFTPVGVTFKGGGFYKTDSRGSSKATSTSATSSTSETGSGSSSSSDTSASSSNGSSNGSSASTPAPASSPSSPTPASSPST
jgi:predicted nucleic acid-binding Zn ribbon protein